MLRRKYDSKFGLALARPVRPRSTRRYPAHKLLKDRWAVTCSGPTKLQVHSVSSSDPDDRSSNQIQINMPSVMNRACLGALRSSSVTAKALTTSTSRLARRSVPAAHYLKPALSQTRSYAQVGTPPRSHKVYDSAAEAVKDVKSGDIVLSGGMSCGSLIMDQMAEPELQASVYVVSQTLSSRHSRSEATSTTLPV